LPILNTLVPQVGQTPGTAYPLTVSIAVAGPMGVPHGQSMMQGAQLAVDEIGTFQVAGQTYQFQLVEVATADMTGDVEATRLAVAAQVEDVHFFIGGFRMEHTQAMLEVVCQDNGKVFLGLGAGGVGLTRNVQDDFDNYRYFFRLLPLNDHFLFASSARILACVVDTLMTDPALPFEYPQNINVYILAENAQWANSAVQAAEAQLLPSLGVNHVGTARPSDTAAADDFAATIADMAAKNTHVVMTFLAGPVGFSWAEARYTSDLPVISAGINAVAQMTAFGNLGDAALYEITLDVAAEEVELSAITQPFLTAFVARHDAYPVYTGAAAYDAIRLLKAAIEATGGSLDSDSIAAVIPGADLDAVSGAIVFYPMAAIDLGEEGRALSAAQAYDLYGDHLLDYYGEPDFASLEANWLTEQYFTDWESPPHLPQDVVYGPAVGNTAIASQWQGMAPDLRKVAVWPMQMPGADLLDRYGDWSFQYPGTQELVILPIFYDTWGS